MITLPNLISWYYFFLVSSFNGGRFIQCFKVLIPEESKIKLSFAVSWCSHFPKFVIFRAILDAVFNSWTKQRFNNLAMSEGHWIFKLLVVLNHSFFQMRLRLDSMTIQVTDRLEETALIASSSTWIKRYVCNIFQCIWKYVWFLVAYGLALKHLAFATEFANTMSEKIWYLRLCHAS